MGDTARGGPARHYLCRQLLVQLCETHQLPLGWPREMQHAEGPLWRSRRPAKTRVGGRHSLSPRPRSSVPLEHQTTSSHPGGQGLVVERRRSGEVGDANGDVIDHFDLLGGGPDIGRHFLCVICICSSVTAGRYDCEGISMRKPLCR